MEATPQAEAKERPRLLLGKQTRGSTAWDCAPGPGAGLPASQTSEQLGHSQLCDGRSSLSLLCLGFFTCATEITVVPLPHGAAGGLGRSRV